MTTSVGIGFSQELNVSLAARDAALQAKTQIKQKPVDFAIVFATTSHGSPEALRIIRQTLNETKIVGCSSASLLFSNAMVTSGIAVLAIHSQDIKAVVGSVNDLTSVDKHIAGSELARNLSLDFGKHRRGALLIFFDGSLRDSRLILKGAHEILGRVFPVIGVGSSDPFLFQETFQFAQDKVFKDSASAILLGGLMSIGFGKCHGWKPLGKPRIATQTKGPLIKTIDHKNASGIYEEFLGSKIEKFTPQQQITTTLLYPLGFYQEGENEYVLRHVITILEDGGMVCNGDIPEGSEVHLMISNKDFLKQAALESARESKEALLGKEPKFVVVFGSLLRYNLLGRNMSQEIDVVREIFGLTTPIMGMCSYGEIVPTKSLNLSEDIFLRNGTIVTLAIA